MKKIISVLSVMVVFSAFVVTGVFAESSQGGLTAENKTNDLCALHQYTQMNFQQNCRKVDGENCTQTGDGAGQSTKCYKFKDSNLRCVARQCPTGLYMPLVFENANDVVREKNARILGYCYSKKRTEQECKGKCPAGGTCEPRYVDWEIANSMLLSGAIQMTAGKAFVGCFCKDCGYKDGGVACDTGGCRFTGTVKVSQKNSAEPCGEVSVTDFKINANETAGQLAQRIFEEKKKANDTGLTRCFKQSAGTKNTDVATQDFDATVSGGNSGSGNGGKKMVLGASGADASKIRDARDHLSDFFSEIDSDRSVWKNADGSFNATRLASDLTAGVVLGTVGGVVSGVLIKKSQVEKGFDALNCTVGGQKIADWGDEFSVGLRR